MVIPASFASASGPKDKEHSTPSPPHSRNRIRHARPRDIPERSTRNDTPTSTSEIQEVIAATMMARKKRMDTAALSTGIPAPILANT